MKAEKKQQRGVLEQPSSTTLIHTINNHQQVSSTSLNHHQQPSTTIHLAVVLLIAKSLWRLDRKSPVRVSHQMKPAGKVRLGQGKQRINHTRHNAAILCNCRSLAQS
jgi:hypothetical protein